MASYNGYAGNGSLGKITKTRVAKVKVVKPILKKLAHSEKNSLDLNRGWEEQSVEQLDNSLAQAWNGSYGQRSNSARDVSFVFPPTAAAYGTAGDVGGNATTGAGTAVGGGVGVGGNSGSVSGGSSNTRAKFQHGRSTSQASTGSGPRGAFVHPFQQMPRTATPPLSSRSYANSLASFDNGPRDYSPTITETEDDVPSHPNTQTQHIAHNSNSSSNIIHHAPPSFSQVNARRPSLASQRTASFSDINASASIPRASTGRTSATGIVSSSRLAHGILTASHSDLHLNLSQGGHSPTGSLGGGFPPPSLASPTSSVAPMSPLRSSLDAASFPRLRSRSELDSAARAEGIRTARRKFEERERAKEEKYDREMIKKRERRDNKEASRIEKEAAARKASMSGSEAIRPGVSQRSTAALTISTGRSGGSGTSTDTSRRDVSSASFWTPPRSSTTGTRRNTDEIHSSAEKIGFAARKYESVPATQAPPSFGPGVDDVRFEPARPRRTNTTKRKTQGYWQGFVLWFRTKLLRISGR